MEQEEIISHRAARSGTLLPASIIVAAILVSGSILYTSGRGRAPVPSAQSGNKAGGQAAGSAEGLALSDRDVILGDPDAPISIIEYGDYQCPFCGRFFTDVESKLREEYIKMGKAKMVYRNMVFLGPESEAAAQAAECAKDSGKFWAYHDALFIEEIKDGEENNGNLDRALFLSLARDLGIDTNTFAACIDGKKYAAQVTSDTAAAKAQSVSATPTTFINERMVRGAVPYEEFKSVIDSLLGAGN